MAKPKSKSTATTYDRALCNRVIAPHVHQIWIGDAPGVDYYKWMEGVKAGAAVCGMRYTRWDWDMLQKEFSSDPFTDIAAELMIAIPSVQVYTLLSDYYRWAVVAAHGGLYLDSDYEVQDARAFGMLTSRSSLTLTGEVFNRNVVTTGIISALDTAATPTAVRIASILRDRLLLYFSTADKTLVDAMIEMSNMKKNRGINGNGVGPKVLRSLALPILKKEGYKWEMCGEHLASSRNKNAYLYHHGKGSWRKSLPVKKVD